MATLTEIQTAHKHTPLGSDSLEFEIHREWRERELTQIINDRELLVSTYTFIAPHPQPREVFACDQDTRVSDHFIDDDLRPMLEARMTDRTFNNRVGYGPDAAINQVISDIYEVSQGFTRDAWIIKYDLTGYFPNANRQRAYDMLREVVETDYKGSATRKDDLLYLIRQAVLSDPTARCQKRSPLKEWEAIPKHKSLFSKDPGIGGAIGRLIWQNTMNYYLDELDHWATDVCGLHYTRFVDDTVIVTNNKEATLALLPEIRRRLALQGCQMHPHKFYCQHYTKGVEFLGRHIRMDRVYVNNRILHRAHVKIAQLNHCPRPSKVQTFLASLNSYTGQCKNANAYGELRNLLERISPEWAKYVHYNDERKCLRANPGYTFRDQQNKLYHIKSRKHHDTQRKRTTAAAARRPAPGGTKLPQ